MSTSNPAKWISAGLLVVVVAVGGGYYLLKHHRTEPASVPAAASTAAAVPAPASTAPQHPISEVTVAPAHASTAPLPSLDDSDGLVHDAMTRFGGDKAGDLLTGKALIPHIVATINALPGKRLPPSVLPVHSPRGSFRATGKGETLTMASANAERYAPYVAVLEKADTDTLVAWYVHNYPLFEEAWRQLGYPQKHFNDRLVQVLDLLLATPDPTQPPYLEGAAGVYRFQNPQLENLAVGQKMLLRLGPKDEAAVKTKLRAIRDAVAGRKMPAMTPTPTPTPSASAG